MSITVTGVTKRFKSFVALDDISLEIPDGRLVGLLGPSGSGKTTLLRIIAGLEQPDAGSVRFQGEDTTRTPLRERRVGFVFQHYALFKHMTIFDNVAFGLTVRPAATRPAKAEIRARVAHLLKMVQLDVVADRYPHQLSGGQRQRIALARALAVEPRVLLLDEPFGALDAQVRMELRRWLRRLHDDTGITTVFVTHDQEEAMEVSDRVVIIHQGKVAQEGTPEEVYRRPANPFVHRFIGQVNVFHSRVDGGAARVGDLELVPAGGAAHGEALAYVRPHDISVAAARDTLHAIPATVDHVLAAGALVRVDLLRDDTGEHVEAALPHARQADLKLASGAKVFIGFTQYNLYGQSGAVVGSAVPAGAPDYQI
jgi:sulfate transport system ATP-binding protein